MRTQFHSSGGRLGAFVGLALFVCSGCDGSADSRPSHAAAGRGISKVYAGQGPVRVVATTGMVADLVASIGGERLKVESLMGEGVDPHLYKASPGDLAKLSAADLIAFNGLHLEGKMGEIFERLARTRSVVAVGDGVPEPLLRSPPEFAGQHDPHIWFDVSLWAQAGDHIAEQLATLDPTHAPQHAERWRAYRERLLKLHDEAKAAITTIPRERRVLVTAHDAFGYFGRAYDIEVRAIQGMSTDSEAGVREISRLVDFIVERGIKAVFVETSVSERNVRALVEGCHSRGREVVIGGQLFSDAMGKAGTADGTYEGMVRHNLRTITGALR